MTTAGPRRRSGRGPTGRGRRLPAVAVAVAGSIGLLLVPGTAGAFTAAVVDDANTSTAGSRFTCSDTFNGTDNRANAFFQYPLTGSGGGTIADVGSHGNTGTGQPGGVLPSAPADASTACPDDPGSYYAPDGATNWISTTVYIPDADSPATFSLAIWFKTTAPGGYLMGLNRGQTDDDDNFGRHIYIASDGAVEFGTHNSNGFQMLYSPRPYNDGEWHQVVATMSPSTGMALWVDGEKVASNSDYTSAEDNPGWWRIGHGPLTSWEYAPEETHFDGGLRFAAAYRVVLSDDEIAAEYANGKP